MSFFENLTNVAGQLMEGKSPAEAAQALIGHVGNMDDSTRQNLGGQLLQAFSQHSGFQGDGSDAAAQAGTNADDVAQGNPGALSSLIGFAQSHPEVLQKAMSACGLSKSSDN